MRFAKFNKYRNAVATVAAHELWHSELALSTDTTIGANGLAADSKHLYAKSANGSSLQVLNISSPRKAGFQAECLLDATEKIVDWNTALYDECLVVAGDSHGMVAVWKDHSEALKLQAHQTTCAISQFLPTVPGIIVSASEKEVKLWNVNATSKTTIWEASSASTIDSIAIKGDGQMLATSTHDGILTIYDPRHSSASEGSVVGKSAAFHAPGRPTRALWLGEKSFLISTGMTKTRERSAALWDQRNLSRPLASLVLQQSTKSLIPLFDEDTSLVYLAEKGDCTIRWVDADPSSSTPLAELGSVVLGHQISGCALLPKHQLNVMGGEIARLYAVVDNCGAGSGGAVIPISQVAPRRTYLDFHSDLFPDTRAPVPAQTYEQWMACEPVSVPRMSLDPVKSTDCLDSLRKAYGIAGTRGDVEDINTEKKVSLSDTNINTDTQQIETDGASPQELSTSANCQPESELGCIENTKSDIASNTSVLEPLQKSSCPQTSPVIRPKRIWKMDQQSRGHFRYLEGIVYRPSEHFINIHDVDQRFSQDNDPIQISSKFIAFACVGAGGQIAILRRDSPGRVPEKPATIVHGANVIAMEFDPFDPAIIATAGTDNKLQMWRIPDVPLSGDSFFELEEYIHVTADRVHQIHFHPLVKGIVAVLVSDSKDQAVYLYHGLMLLAVVGKTDEGIHSFSWSPEGEHIALTTKKSRQVRVYDAHTQKLLGKGPGMNSIRPSRIAWIGNNYICLSGFGTGSQRQVAVYSADDLSQPIARKTIDVGPGLLVPFADPDCNIIYFDDRGSRLTHAFEISGKDLVELPKLESTQPSIGMAMLPKRYANIAKCELLRGYRLNAHSIESVGFRVPRKRPEYFQDDIFPSTIDWETPALDTASWIGGTVAEPAYIDLCPQGMTPLSQAPPEPVRRRAFETQPEEGEDNTKDAIKAMLGRVDSTDDENADAMNSKEGESGSDWDSE
ncbi:hypothetical protein IW140_006116 [Coemansia sp. RSA 1813]|nr:hypothetical protein EV178_006093 [Coemansia sp. RSA 1646]KAJ1767040.1 hypothetical protein LPJ74_005584 [Coemansia sp. RSA 1843]KAJ2085844.1 hypothetical protein IW138_006074 [Coemansia sp. RSA 986]KAJ2210694.1 hypothetical protein EV179_006052 [Coemansia sp. RSA 487]KAJ2563433.1 hypothetical protein IW140_006116 [Coemansia sp. RSA 1813]